MKKFLAERINITVARHLHIREALDRATWDVYLANLGNDVACELHTHIYGIRGGHISVHRQWPRDWWQAFKERWFPDWAKEFWPVQYERVDVEETIYAVVCPHVDGPSRSSHLQFMGSHA